MYTRTITFNGLRQANNSRQQEWYKGKAEPSLAFRALEMSGECGEAVNKIKKILRMASKVSGSTATQEEVGEELADVVISADLVARSLGLDMGQLVMDKFNTDSAKYGFKSSLSPEEIGTMDTLLRRLRDERDMYQEQVIQLKDYLASIKKSSSTPPCWNLTENEELFFIALMQKDVCDKEFLLRWMYDDKPETPKEKILDVIVCKLRKKIKPYGIVIAAVSGRGWALVDRNNVLQKLQEKAYD